MQEREREKKNKDISILRSISFETTSDYLMKVKNNIVSIYKWLDNTMVIT